MRLQNPRNTQICRLLKCWSQPIFSNVRVDLGSWFYRVRRVCQYPDPASNVCFLLYHWSCWIQSTEFVRISVAPCCKPTMVVAHWHLPLTCVALSPFCSSGNVSCSCWLLTHYTWFLQLTLMSERWLLSSPLSDSCMFLPLVSLCESDQLTRAFSAFGIVAKDVKIDEIGDIGQ